MPGSDERRPAEEPENEGAGGQEPFYIQAASSRAEDRSRVLEHGETFAVFDRFGDVRALGLGEQGVYHAGTRFLSRLELRFGGRRPLLLSSTVKKENDLFTVDLSNPDLKNEAGHILLPHGVLHIARSKFLWQGTCYERVRISNFGSVPVETDLVVDFAADFTDVFEVRGMKRERRGRRLDDELAPASVALGYEGLDGVVRRARLTFDPVPETLNGRHGRYQLRIPPRETVSFTVYLQCEIGRAPTGVVPFEDAFRQLQGELARGPFTGCHLHADQPDLDEWISRSVSDLQMMITETPEGPYPYAGVPWFSAPFGRDGIITALEVLWAAPRVARGVLGYLAATQATERDAVRDAQPGKILHEARGGEMAALGEVPFGRYYGSVDSTPLYVILAGAYWKRTGDLEFLNKISPHVDRALGWLSDYGDLDGDGFIEYARQAPTGLVQQGWKDSHDSVFHADGSDAEGPIALCEVQGYTYAAWLAAADIARALGRSSQADAHAARAETLKRRFVERFWDEDLGTYVLALDGAKRPCRVRTSNAGHALWSGIADEGHARRVAEALMSSDGFSGWGVRTLGAAEARYNPMSYHNGSVWPHDNALVAAGFARYGFRDLALRLFDALLGVSLFADLRRLPELFCGFGRRGGEGPIAYPVACAPQAWASGAVFMLLGSALGLQIDGRRGEVSFVNPRLPQSISRLRLAGLEVGTGRVDLLLENYPHDVGLTVLRREGDVRVVVVK